MEWINPKNNLPPAKAGWNHSNRVLVWYKGNEHDVEDFGIAYYNYDPPYAKPGFTDFAHYGRQPDLWQPIEPPKQ
jgi:hypothetical protein